MLRRHRAAVHAARGFNRSSSYFDADSISRRARMVIRMHAARSIIKGFALMVSIVASPAFAQDAGAGSGAVPADGVYDMLVGTYTGGKSEGLYVYRFDTKTGDATRVSESLRGFAHEIRNPLAAISGAAQLLERRADDSRQRELAQLIRDEAARLAALAERLLGVRTAMATRAINVHAVLERAAELLEAERAGVVVVRDYDPSLPAWQGDPDRLLQAVLNLVRNAVEANAARIILRSRAEAGWRDARGQRVPALRIEVEDDGDGVPGAIAASLFEPMVSGRVDGSGLGLALAREIAREHGGELTYAPREAGSCFMIRLPRHPRTGEGG